MTIGPAPMIRIVERSVRFGIALPARIDQAQKKRRHQRRPVNFHRPADGYPSRRPEPYPIISGEGRAWRALPSETVEGCTKKRVGSGRGSLGPPAKQPP